MRSVKLFLLGFTLNTLGWTELAKPRVPGVLQRFGICYFVVTLAGYSGPGGLHRWSPSANNSGCIGGITGHLDRAFFSSQHIYGNPTAKAEIGRAHV